MPEGTLRIEAEHRTEHDQGNHQRSVAGSGEGDHDSGGGAVFGDSHPDALRSRWIASLWRVPSVRGGNWRGAAEQAGHLVHLPGARWIEDPHRFSARAEG